MVLVLTTPPQSEPFTPAQAKAHLEVEHSDDDAMIDAFVAAARSSVEAVLKASLLPTVWTYKTDGFPLEIRLPVGPVLDASLVVVKYIDDAGVEQTLATDDYQVSVGETGVIRAAYGKTWPSTRPEMDAVRVQFTAGWASADDVPRAILAALRLMMGHLYEHREAVNIGNITSELPLAYRNLLVPFIRHN